MAEMSMPLFGEAHPTFHQGTTDASREASASGARAALVDRKQKVDVLRRLWRKPYTMQQVQQISGFPLASVCSIKACLDRELTAVDTVEKLWADGRLTKRTVWQLSAYVVPPADRALS